MTKEMQQMLIRFKQRYDDIKEAKDIEIRRIRVEALITDMENTFEIPLVGTERIQAFNFAFPEVLKFYREVRQIIAI